MKKINIAELLKDCPKGMEFDCTMYNNVKLDRVNNEKVTFPIKVLREDGNFITLTKYGQYTDASFAKCVIFPKGKTTWEDFIPPCGFKNGDVVSINLGGNLWYGIYKEEHNQDLYCHVSYSIVTGYTYYSDNSLCDVNNITDIRLATEEEKDKLFKVIKDNGYKWNPETKILEKLLKFKVGDKITNGKTSLRIGYIDDEYYYDISKNLASRLPIKNQDKWNLIPKKFDITTLKPFQEVLVRGNVGQKWIHDFFGFMDKEKGYPFVCVGHYVIQCIPYNGNEHLLGKTDDCDDYYKTWE